MTQQPLDYQQNTTPERKGFRLVHVLSVTGAVALGVALLVPAMQRDRCTLTVHCASNLHQIGQAFLLYASDHTGEYPPNLPTLMRAELLAGDTMVCPRSSERKAASPDELREPGHSSYIYVGSGLTAKSAPACIVAFEDPANHDMEVANVLFADGHVEECSFSQLMQALNDLSAGHNPPTSPVTFTQRTAEREYELHWKSRMPQLKAGPWKIATTQPTTAPGLH